MPLATTSTQRWGSSAHSPGGAVQFNLCDLQALANLPMRNCHL
jgi:hypothetical protein